MTFGDRCTHCTEQLEELRRTGWVTMHIRPAESQAGCSCYCHSIARMAGVLPRLP